MVKETKENSKTLYVCEECDFKYEDKEWAEKCQAFFEEHHACSVEITKHAVT